MAPAPSLLQWGSMRLCNQRLCVDVLRAWPSVMQFLRSTTGVHCHWHRGKLSVLKASSWLDVRPWNAKASTGYGYGVVLALVPISENVAQSTVAWRYCCQLAGGATQVSVGLCQSSTMGLLGVKGITTPEVKFLDRCETNCSEGVLQVHVRRSRM